MIKLTCAACGGRSNRLSPCPCELGEECPAPLGVCPPCWAVVQANAVARHIDQRRGVQSRPLAQNASRAGLDVGQPYHSLPRREHSGETL